MSFSTQSFIAVARRFAVLKNGVIFAAVFVLSLLQQQSRAQIANLKFSNATNTYAEITGGTSIVAGASAVGAVSAVTNIGYTFNYQGVNYTQFSANAAGLLKLGSVVLTTENANSTVSTTNTPKLFAWWDATYTGSVATTGGVSYSSTGTAPNRVLTVQWRVAYASNTTTALSFQVKLYETSNKIEYLYGGTAVYVSTYSASVGMGGLSAADEYLSIYTGNISTPNPTGSTNLAFNANNNFPGGQIYTFTPKLAATSPSCTLNNPNWWIKADEITNKTRTLLNVAAASRTVSSQLSASFSVTNSTLTATNAWSPSTAEGQNGNPTPTSNAIGYITLDLGVVKSIDGIATLSATGTTSGYVTDYTVKVSNDDITYTTLGVFNGNEAYGITHYADFPASVSCRYVRVIPGGFVTSRAMRLDVYTVSSSTMADGTKIDNWDDISGNVNNAYQATAGNQPTYNTNTINFNPAVNFNNASSSYMEFPDMTNIRASYWCA